jgi:hypothetical protein
MEPNIRRRRPQVPLRSWTCSTLAKLERSDLVHEHRAGRLQLRGSDVTRDDVLMHLPRYQAARHGPPEPLFKSRSTGDSDMSDGAISDVALYQRAELLHAWQPHMNDLAVSD